MVRGAPLTTSHLCTPSPSCQSNGTAPNSNLSIRNDWRWLRTRRKRDVTGRGARKPVMENTF